MLLPACRSSARDPGAAPAPSVAAPLARRAGGVAGRGSPKLLASSSDVSYFNGKVLTDVGVVGVWWGSSGFDPTVHATMPGFYAAVVDSPYMDWLSEYNTPTQSICRGAMAGFNVIEPGNTKKLLVDAEIQNELAQQIDAGNLDSDGDGDQNANTLYMVHFPKGIGITMGDGTPSCTDGGFCAYHSSFTHKGIPVRYAVLPDMSPGSGCDTGCGDGSLIENQESAASHELMEAVTDPDPLSGSPGWTGSAGEIGDSCSHQDDLLPGTGYTVQKLWSNQAGTCVTTRPVPVSNPHIDSITPATGPYNTQTPVIVSGSCFSHPTATVSKGGQVTTADIMSWDFTPTMLYIHLPTSPDGAAGIGNLTIANSGATTSAVTPFNYFYVGPANVSISPTSGGMQGGTLVNISGKGFAVYPDVTTATFDGIPVTVNCSSTTSCLTAAPPHDPGTVKVVVTASGSSQPSANDFTYVGPQITNVTPNAGPISGGTSVTVHGINMVDTSKITFYANASIAGVNVGSVLCLREGQTDGSCSFTTPAIANAPQQPVDIRLTVQNSTGSSWTTPISGFDKFTYHKLPQPTALTFSGDSYGGGTATGTVMLDGNAPMNDAVVSLALAPGAPPGIVSLPPNATVKAQHLSGNFQVPILAQNFTGSVPIVATYGGASVTGVLGVNPTLPPTLSPIAELCSGQQYLETITLAEPAPPNGGVVQLKSGSSWVTVPANVPVPGGATTVTFTIITGTPATKQTGTVSATYFGIDAAPISFPVLPAAAVALDISPTSVDGGDQATGTVTVCTAVPPGSSVTLSSNNVLVGVPATVPISGTSTNFTIGTGGPHFPTTATITATYQGTSAQRQLTLLPGTHCIGTRVWCDCVEACMTPQQCAKVCSQ